MKKALVMLLCLMMAVSAAAAERVEPLPANEGQPDFADGSFGIQVEGMDRIGQDDGLTLSLFTADRYDPEQIAHLAPGDVILVAGKTYTVTGVTVRDERWFDDDPEELVYEVDTEEEDWDGIWFSRLGDEDCFVHVGDWTAKTYAGTITVPLPLPDSFVYYDYPGGEDPEPGTEADLMKDLRERSPEFFNPYNTTAVFENGSLTEIHNRSYPWGPDVEDGADEDDA